MGYCRRGEVYFAFNEIDKAKVIFEKTLELDPNYGIAKNI